jgi:hypothetical protein
MKFYLNLWLCPFNSVIYTALLTKDKGFLNMVLEMRFSDTVDFSKLENLDCLYSAKFVALCP